MGGEVVDSLPLVGPRADISGLHLGQKLFVPVSHRRESDIGASFDDWLCLGVEHDSAVVAVAHAELLAEDNEVAIFAVPQKDARFVGTQHYVASLALIHISLRGKVMQVQLRIIRMLHLKRRSIQLSRPSGQKLVTFLIEHKCA